MTRAAAFFFLLVIFTAALPAAAAPRALAAPAVAPGVSNPDFMGMVIRDPWYDFGTNPKFPGQPNYDFQDTMGATLASMGVRWVRLDFHIVVPLADVQCGSDCGRSMRRSSRTITSSTTVAPRIT